MSLGLGLSIWFGTFGRMAIWSEQGREASDTIPPDSWIPEDSRKVKTLLGVPSRDLKIISNFLGFLAGI